MISKEKLLLSLEKLRPFLQEDLGDIELVEIGDDGIVKVRFLGSCNNCPLSSMTLRAGIERALMREFPSIKRIEAVN
ncbi:MAG: NifU family protein [Ignavibacterium sp.]|nr:NifU family protein [Ignavibacterium sp.]MCX7610914.1 NifU family protein [Ignavibacterium sp.]MDW8376509.1 NifU family protein [Ignavibacteriales bacterium]